MSEYPTDGELEQLRNWPIADFDGAMRYLAERWIWENYIGEVAPGVWFISTGGWSGHESMIDALQESLLWTMHWRSSRHGGHFVLASHDANEDAIHRAACLCEGCRDR